MTSIQLTIYTTGFQVIHQVKFIYKTRFEDNYIKINSFVFIYIYKNFHIEAKTTLNEHKQLNLNK